MRTWRRRRSLSAVWLKKFSRHLRELKKAEEAAAAPPPVA
jgi:hypothetical protein